MRLQRIIESELNRLFVFELEDGFAVEAVHYRGDTLCISTQVGCAVKCGFCASGRHGLFRNLSFEEMIFQYYEVSTLHKVRRIAIAGIGEPLANWKNVRRAFMFFKDRGFKVSFYTTGFPLQNLKELLSLPHNGVSLSIHFLKEDLRRELMPHAGRLSDLLSTLREILPTLSRKRRKKISLAYLLLRDVNDSRSDLELLGKLAKELGLGVTLLYYNDVAGFKPVSPQEYEDAFLFLKSMGVRVTLSNRFRRDPIGGCGTLTVGRFADIDREEAKV